MGKSINVKQKNREMKKLELDHVSLNVNVKKVVKVGSIEIIALIYCCLGRHKNDVKAADGRVISKKGSLWLDVNDWDIGLIKYNGVEISDYKNIKKFQDFHKEMGIDLFDQVSKEINKEDTDINADTLVKLIGFKI